MDTARRGPRQCMDIDGGAACGLEFDGSHLTGPEPNRAKFDVLGAPERERMGNTHLGRSRVCALSLFHYFTPSSRVLHPFGS